MADVGEINGEEKRDVAKATQESQQKGNSSNDTSIIVHISPLNGKLTRWGIMLIRSVSNYLLQAN